MSINKNTVVQTKLGFPVWRTIKVGTFPTIDELEGALQGVPCGRTWFKEFPFQIQSLGELDLVAVSGTALLQNQNMSRAEVCQLGAFEGLDECPPEVAPQLLIQGQITKWLDELKIASTQAIGGRTDTLMSVNSRLGIPWVNWEVDPEEGFVPETMWIFVKPPG